MKNSLMKIFRSNQFKTFCWQVAVGVLALSASFFADLNVANSAMLVAFCNFLSKEINKRYL